MRIVKIILVFLLSIGWIVPAYAALFTYLQYWDAEVSILLRGLEPNSNFPFIVEIERNLLICFIWLGAAIGFWSFIGASRLFSKKDKSNSIER